MNKAKKFYCSKDYVFSKLYNESDDKNILYTDDDNKARSRIPFYTPLVEQRKNIDHSTILHADVANISFFSKSAVDPKYCLPIADLFTLKIYTYSMKSKNFLKKKLGEFIMTFLKKDKKMKSCICRVIRNFSRTK